MKSRKIRISLFERASRLTLSLIRTSFSSKLKGFLHKISSSAATWNPPGRYSPFQQDSFFFFAQIVPTGKGINTAPCEDGIFFPVYCTHKCGHFLRVAPAHKIGQATI